MAPRKNKNAPAAASPSLLASIVAATAGGNVFFTSEADRATLNPAFIEVNTTMVDAQGKMATRASAAGIASLAPAASAPATNGDAATTKVKPIISAIVNVAVPRPAKAKRGGHIKPVYPFDAMEVNHSFFVEATDDNQNPAKALASTVSSATRRYMVEDLDTNGNKQYVTVDVEKEVTQPDGSKVTQTVQETRVKMKKTRVFEVHPMADGAPWGFTGKKGAGVWRTA